MAKKPVMPVKCIGCKKTPDEITEYKFNGQGLTPTQYMMKVEGTYGKFRRNSFYCTSCYIKAGMPVYRR